MNKIRAGVVGVGYLGSFHAQKYQVLAKTNANVELVAFDYLAVGVNAA